MDSEILQRALEREKQKRARAELLLEEKSRELFLSYEDLKQSHDKLDKAHETLKRQQKQLVQSEKMASLGIISAGVAHEINNPIGFVLSNITTLGENVSVFSNLARQLNAIFARVKQGDPIDSDLSALESYARAEDLDFLIEDGQTLIGETIEGITRVKGIVDGLKSFARTDSNQYVASDINEGILATLKVLNNQTKYDCRLETDLGELPLINCQPGKIQQVIMNLVVNASQAIEKNGLIRIASREDNNAFHISVVDNGRGIPDDQLKDLFTPFYTTKPVGEGTGLGLSISLGIVEEHGGRIDVRSEVGSGTRFTVILPGSLRAA